MNYTPYVWGSQKPYLDYLQDRHYLEDLNDSNKALALDIRKDLRELAFDKEALLQKGFELMQIPIEEIRELGYGIGDLAIEQIETREVIAKTFDAGIERISYDLDNLKNNLQEGLTELNATFQWCCSNLLSQLGGMKDSISELIKAVKSPMQTAALEHFRDARTAFENELYPEAVEELQAAINGVPGVSAGYKMEWRVYQLLGLIRLGFDGCDLSLVDLADAEDSFLKAARYAKSQSNSDTAKCYLSAGWAAYCQGSFDTAIAHLNQAVELDAKLAEAWFLMGKTLAAKKDNTALDYLHKAINLDPIFKLKAVADGDYLTDEEGLIQCLEQVNYEYYITYLNTMKKYLHSNPEFRGIKGLDKEIECMCRSNALKDNTFFEYEFSIFQAKLNSYVKLRKKVLRSIKQTKANLKKLTEVLNHPDFPLWGIENPLPLFQERLQEIITAYDKNEYSDSEWDNIRKDYTNADRQYLTQRTANITMRMELYRDELKTAVKKYYNKLLRPCDWEIERLKQVLESKINKLGDFSEISTTPIKGKLLR